MLILNSRFGKLVGFVEISNRVFRVRRAPKRLSTNFYHLILIYCRLIFFCVQMSPVRRYFLLLRGKWTFKYPSIWIRDQIMRYLSFKGQNCKNSPIFKFQFFDFGKHCVPPGCVQEQEQQENSLKLCVRCVWSGLQGMRIVTIPLAKPNF